MCRKTLLAHFNLGLSAELVEALWPILYTCNSSGNICSPSLSLKNPFMDDVSHLLGKFALADHDGSTGLDAVALPSFNKDGNTHFFVEVGNFVSTKLVTVGIVDHFEHFIKK